MSDSSDLSMRIIVHLSDPTDMVLAMRAVKSSIAGNHDECGYSFEDGALAFVRRNKTGWTVWITRDARDG